MDTYAIILAAGKGTRMKSKIPKVMHKVNDYPMIEHIVNNLEKLSNMKKIIVVVGHGAEVIEEHFRDRVKFIRQEQQLGTGHAVLQAKQMLEGEEGNTLIITGDTPLLSHITMEEMTRQKVEGTKILVAEQENPFGYGRILEENNQVIKIVEEKDATEEEKLIKKVNTGISCFDNKILFKYIEELKPLNSQGEYYLTEMVEILNKKGYKTESVMIDNPEEAMGVNDRLALAKAEVILQNKITENHMKNGVTFINPNSVYIGIDVKIDKDTIIEPNVQLKGKTIIGEDCFIGSNTTIIDSEINKSTSVIHSYITKSKIGENVSIGPFSHIRPESQIDDRCKIGNFVEVKKSKLGKGTKASHLSYLGDAEVGKNVNIGCGVITVNYDGFNKSKTKIEDDSFIGSNSNLVAPVTIGENSFVAAGSTIIKDVPKDSLAIAREKQVTKDNYMKKGKI